EHQPPVQALQTSSTSLPSTSYSEHQPPIQVLQTIKHIQRRDRNSSWVWDYVDKNIIDGYRCCQVLVVKNGQSIPCGNRFKSSCSTTNIGNHLSKVHRIMTVYDSAETMK